MIFFWDFSGDFLHYLQQNLRLCTLPFEDAAIFLRLRLLGRQVAHVHWHIAHAFMIFLCSSAVAPLRQRKHGRAIRGVTEMAAEAAALTDHRMTTLMWTGTTRKTATTSGTTTGTTTGMMRMEATLILGVMTKTTTVDDN